MKYLLLTALIALLLPVAVVDTSPPETTVLQIVEVDADECSHAPDTYFGPACAYHDKCYYNSWAERSVCDKWFLEDMLNKCDDLPLQPTGFCGAQAFAYYAIVRLFGHSYYSFFDKSPGNDICLNQITDKEKRQSLDSHVMIVT